MNEPGAGEPGSATPAHRAALLDSILQRIPHGVCVFGSDQRVAMINPAYEAVMAGASVAVGESLAEIARRRLEAGEFGGGEPARHYAEQLVQTFGIATTRRRQRPGGTTIEVRTAPLPDGGHLSVVTDVSALVAAEAELSRRAEIMDVMLASIGHGIILWGPDRRIVACNHIVAELLSAPPGLLRPGRSLDEVIDSAFLRGNLGAGEVGRWRAQLLRQQDRSRSHVDQRLTELGRVIEVRTDPAPGGSFVTTYTDVTAIREAEVALREAKSAAEAANAGKSRFLAAMSQELRMPLQAILEHSERLARATAGSAHTSARAIHDAGQSLLSVVETILDVARLEAGRFELSNDRVDIPQLVRACVRHSDPTAAAAEVALVADLPRHLPPVRGDERRLRQALGHLVVNAVRFTQALGSVSIVARLEAETGNLLIEVADTGIGIPEAELERVFEPFARLEGGQETAHRGPAMGAGLGLYVSRALLRAHGGEVLLRTRAGQGTTAVMVVPASRVLHPAHGAPK